LTVSIERIERNQAFANFDANTWSRFRWQNQECTPLS
jgi:hypothetical protein